MLGKFTRQDEADRGLDLTGRNGRFFRIGRELGSLGGNTLENVVDKRVEDGHGLVRDTRIGMDLLEYCGGNEKMLRIVCFGSENGEGAHLCRYRMSKSPCGSAYASSCPRQRRAPPSSQF